MKQAPKKPAEKARPKPKVLCDGRNHDQDGPKVLEQPKTGQNLNNLCSSRCSKCVKSFFDLCTINFQFLCSFMKAHPHLKNVEFLLKVVPEILEKTDSTSLKFVHVAINYQRDDLLDLALSKNHDQIRTKTNEGLDLITYAMQKDRLRNRGKCINFLLNWFKRECVKIPAPQCVLLEACLWKRTPDVPEEIFEKVLDATPQRFWLQAAMKARDEGNMDAVFMMLERNRDLLPRLRLSSNAAGDLVHYFIKKKNVDMVDTILVQGKVNVAIESVLGNVFEAAVAYDLPRATLERILEHDPKIPQVCSPNGMSPIHATLHGLNPMILRYLIDELGVDPRSKDTTGNTALFSALDIWAGSQELSDDQEEILRILLAATLTDEDIPNALSDSWPKLSWLMKSACRWNNTWLFNFCLSTFYGRRWNEKWRGIFAANAFPLNNIVVPTELWGGCSARIICLFLHQREPVFVRERYAYLKAAADTLELLATIAFDFEERLVAFYRLLNEFNTKHLPHEYNFFALFHPPAANKLSPNAALTIFRALKTCFRSLGSYKWWLIRSIVTDLMKREDAPKLIKSGVLQAYFNFLSPFVWDFYGAIKRSHVDNLTKKAIEWEKEGRLSLKNLCRLKIRKTIAENSRDDMAFVRFVDQVDIPLSIQKYLLYID